MAQALVEAIAEMREDDALALAQTALDEGTPPLEVLEDCRTAMTLVGDKFEAGEYFVPELILAGEMLREVSELVKPRLVGSAAQVKHGKVVLGTVQGDIHDIGKDIVFFMLDVNGFDVTDLGVDVPVSTFVDKVREIEPDVVALSGFLTLSYDAMKDTVKALEDAGLRDRRQGHGRRRRGRRPDPRVRQGRRIRGRRHGRGQPRTAMDIGGGALT